MLLITTFVELRVVAGRSRQRAGRPQAVSRRLRCAVALRRTAWSEQGMGAAWHGRGMASVNPTRLPCVIQMGKTHSKPLAARHGRGMLCVNRPLWDCFTFYLLSDAAPVSNSKMELGNAPRNMQLAQICGASLTCSSTRFSLAAV
jgi:hypothetical protein